MMFFGFFISGPNPSGGNYNNYNIARIPNTTLPVTINNVNSGSYSTYYVNNELLGGTTIVYDGFTKVLTAWAKVVPCVQYHIKLAVGDAGDQSYDSGVFLEANSFSSPTLSVSTSYVNNTPLVILPWKAGCNDVTTVLFIKSACNKFYRKLYNSWHCHKRVDYPTHYFLLKFRQNRFCLFNNSRIWIPLQKGQKQFTSITKSIRCNTIVDTVEIFILDYPINI